MRSGARRKKAEESLKAALYEQIPELKMDLDFCP